eukprot:SAG31_NODE_31057_length_372_cov_6.315018_1_plen_74_part_01
MQALSGKVAGAAPATYPQRACIMLKYPMTIIGSPTVGSRTSAPGAPNHQWCLGWLERGRIRILDPEYILNRYYR